MFHLPNTCTTGFCGDELYEQWSGSYEGGYATTNLSICIIIPVRISHVPWPFFCHHLLLGNRLGMTSEIGFESLVLSLQTASLRKYFADKLNQVFLQLNSLPKRNESVLICIPYYLLFGFVACQLSESSDSFNHLSSGSLSKSYRFPQTSP